MRNTVLLNSCKQSLKKFAAVALAAVTVVCSMPGQANAAKATSIKDIFVSEDNYAKTMDSVVEPYLDRYKQTGYITGQDKVSLYYEKYIKKNAKGTIVISHGFTENLEKYDEMIYYFLNMGYSVYGIEHRGHSRSGRLGIDEYQVNVESFNDYVKDLKTFLDEIVVPEASKDNLYLYAHSMGGAIGARFLETYTNYFDAAILSAPMLEINSGNIPPFFAKLLAHGLSITKYANQYVLGHGPYDGTYDFEGANTTSEARYARAWETRENNPVLQMGGGSYKWLSESYHATQMATSYGQASKVKIPVILFQAGQDSLVGSDGQNKFVKYAKNCKMVRYENAKHEIYAETDEILQDYLGKVFKFLKAN